IVLNTTGGEYGFECEFKSGLNIVRGNNSSGKSTLVNSLIYSLGMEEILGGKGEKTLPYALKEYVESEKKDKIRIVSSYVYLQIATRNSNEVNFKRAIHDSYRYTKQLEVIHGAPHTGKKQLFNRTSENFHD